MPLSPARRIISSSNGGDAGLEKNFGKPAATIRKTGMGCTAGAAQGENYGRRQPSFTVKTNRFGLKTAPGAQEEIQCMMREVDRIRADVKSELGKPTFDLAKITQLREREKMLHCQISDRFFAQMLATIEQSRT